MALVQAHKTHSPLDPLIAAAMHTEQGRNGGLVVAWGMQLSHPLAVCRSMLLHFFKMMKPKEDTTFRFEILCVGASHPNVGSIGPAPWAPGEPFFWSKQRPKPSQVVQSVIYGSGMVGGRAGKTPTLITPTVFRPLVPLILGVGSSKMCWAVQLMVAPPPHLSHE